MEHNEFSTFDIIKALKIPRERLKDWMSQGFITPTTPAEGKGTKAVFTLLDVYCLMLFKQVLTFGIDRKTAAEFIQGFKERESDGNKETTHIIFRFDNIDGERVVRTMTISGGQVSINIANARIGGFAEGRGKQIPPIFPTDYDQNYDGFIVVNFQKIKATVDRAFSLA